MGQKKQIDRYQVSCFQEFFVDLFAGGGGASMGIEQALCLPIFAAVNHDPDAIAQHAANHKWTKHYQTSVWDVEPETICEGRPVGLLWASPDCKPYPKSKQVARCSNAVCPPLAEALVRANLPEWCSTKMETMEQIHEAVAI